MDYEKYLTDRPYIVLKMIKMFYTYIQHGCICYVEINDGEIEKISKLCVK